MFKKATAITGFGIGHFINATTGAAVTTGTPTCKRTLDGTGGACANAASYNTDGAVWEIDLDAADMNGDVVVLSFTLTDCLPISYTIRTSTKLVSDLNDYAGGDTSGTTTLLTRLSEARAGALTDWLDGGRLDLLLDAIKAKTDLGLLNTTWTDTKAGYLDEAISAAKTLTAAYDAAKTAAAAGAAMALTSGERTTLAAAIEAAIINELDGTAVMQAIADLIASDMTTGDLSVVAIATATRDAILNRVLAGNHDTEDTVGKLLQYLDAAISGIPTNPMLDTEDGSSFSAIPDMATATNQTTIAEYIDTEVGAIIDHLTDIKGTGFAKDTHSLPQCLTATGFSTFNADTDTVANVATVGTLTNAPTDMATATNQTTILNRIGAFTGTGVNTILGFFKALLSKAATLPTDVGGTFDPAADSTEAIRDRGDATWGAGTVPTANQIADEVYDSGRVFPAANLVNAPGGGTSTITVLPYTGTAAGTGELSSHQLVAYQHSAATFALGVYDADGDPVDLSGRNLAWVAYDPNDPATSVLTVRNYDGETAIVITGESSNTAQVSLSAVDMASAANWAWILRDATNDLALMVGKLRIIAVPAIPVAPE